MRERGEGVRGEREGHEDGEEREGERKRKTHKRHNTPSSSCSFHGHVIDY